MIYAANDYYDVMLVEVTFNPNFIIFTHNPRMFI